MGTRWDDTNFRYRSAIVRASDGAVVSQGFGKFVNFGEKPDFQPWEDFWPIQARHKMDGSLLIVSRYKGKTIIRTRGTVDARSLPNGHEIDFLIGKYPKAFDNSCLDENYSLLYEWTTPNNIIVLREHNEPTLTLIGIVDNSTCCYELQSTLDVFAQYIGVGRPDEHVYSSVEECISDVSAWVGKEGVVLYSPDGQTLKKIKAEAYLMLHRVATGVKGVKNVLDLWLSAPERFDTFERFYAYVESTLDFEIAEKIKNEMTEVVDAWLQYDAAVCDLQHFVSAYVSTHDSSAADYRKTFALLVQANYTDWRSGLAFTLFIGKQIEERQLKNAMLTLLEKR